MSTPVIKVVIPARNEELALGKVLAEIPDMIDAVIVADNGSTDNTAKVARSHGAIVVSVPEAGYGRACLAGIAEAEPCDVIVFLDGDASDYPVQMIELVAPIIAGKADLVIGSRVKGQRQRGSLTMQQRFGNALACLLMKMFWGSKFTDLGPFRAIRKTSLDKLNMEAPTFGWTVEMQVRALKQGLRCDEIAVDYRRRIGKSKISGTVRGVILAGYYILSTIFREAFSRR